MPTRQTAAPAVSVVTRDELKAHLRITSTDEDALLDSLLETAIDEIDGTGLLGRAMVEAEYTLTGPRFWGDDLDLDIGPATSLVSINLVRPDDTVEAQDVGDFTLLSDGERACVRGTWGSLADRPDAVRVVYRAGFGTTAAAVPPGLRHAVKLLAAHRFEVRDEVVIGTIASQIPIGVERLIDLHRTRVFG
ncbi:MAG: phage head-tail connector protein [Pseudomonadota bacterium]